MPKVFFYFNAWDRLAYAAALVHKVWGQGRGFALFVPDPERAQAIDRLLWTHPPLGFAPHCRAEAALAAETPILLAARLGDLPAEASRRERLLNLADTVPEGFEDFANVIEIVGKSDAEKAPARQRFLHYKAAGCPLESLDVGR
ncbi:MAG: DNA polymerase III subunit chi [Zoogloeaceae bacterium]|jgi:DNA polymerase-3 subunit chi|nr:DNA polymerase III subunit chi [Zoogloeaceae bacterium]